jgi:ABC-type Fe3+-hydroxamate transport system substrate-binding protein
LVPSVTETLLAWGVEPIAVTRFCEQPDRRQVGGTKNPDVAAIVDLAPDLIVMDREENRIVDAEALQAHGLALHVLHITSLADVNPAMLSLAAAIGVGPRSMAGNLGTSAATLSDPTAPSSALRAWVPIWRRPWMSIGGATYGSTLLAAAGITNVLVHSTDPYPQVSLDEVAALKPEVILAPSEPYRFSARHLPELEAVAPTVLVDGRDLFWWGARTPAALARLRLLAEELRAARPLRSSGSTPTGPEAS